MRKARTTLGAAMMLLAAIPATARAVPAVHTVVIDKLKFGPIPGTVHVGDTILWVNRDIFRHSATARDHSFDIQLPPASKARMPVRRKGIFKFFCTYHPGMIGTLVVK
jgi:plastocyanin